MTTNSTTTVLIDDDDEAIQFVENGNNISTATGIATTNPTRMTMTTTTTTKQHIQHFIQPNYSIILFEYLFRSSVLPELLCCVAADTVLYGTKRYDMI